MFNLPYLATLLGRDLIYLIMIDPVTLGAIITGGSSLLSGIFGSSAQRKANETNLQIARETNAQNYRMFQEQLNYNTAMMDKQNAYNTPTAQRQRYEDAGINPYLALGNITSGSQQSSLTAPSAPNMVTPQVQPENAMALSIQQAGEQALNAYIGLAQAKADLNIKDEQANSLKIENYWKHAKLQEEIALMRKQGVKLDRETTGLGIQNDFNTRVLDTNIAQAEETLKKTRQETESLRIENDLRKLDLDLANKYQEKRVISELKKLAMEVSTGYQNANTNLYNAKTNRINANTNQFVASYNYVLVRKQMAEIDARIGKIFSETEGQNLSNSQYERLMDIVYGTALANQYTAMSQADKDKFFMDVRQGKYGKYQAYLMRFMDSYKENAPFLQGFTGAAIGLLKK